MRWNRRKFASMGGKARAEKLTAEERREISRLGGIAARGKPRKKYRRRRKTKRGKKATVRKTK